MHACPPNCEKGQGLSRMVLDRLWKKSNIIIILKQEIDPTSFNCFSNPLTHVVNIDNKEDNKEDDTLH